MIKVDIFDITSFKCFFDVVSSAGMLVLSFTKDGLRCSVLNKSHTCFYNVFYDMMFFDDYIVDDEIKVLVDADEFYKILRSARKNESLTIEFSDELIKYIFSNDDNKRTIQTPLINDDLEMPQPPAVDSLAEVVVRLDILKPVFSDADKLISNGELRLCVHNNNFVLKSNNDLSVDYETELYSSLITGENCTSKYSLDFLQELVKLKDIDNNIELGLGNDLPLTWKVITPDSLIECSGLIAPRLEEN